MQIKSSGSTSGNAHDFGVFVARSSVRDFGVFFLRSNARDFGVVQGLRLHPKIVAAVNAQA